VPFARNHLVLLDDVHRLFDTRHRVEHFRLERALVTDRADQRALGPARDVYRQAMRSDLRFHRFDLVRSCIGLHNDNHVGSPEKNRAASGPPDRCLNSLLLVSMSYR